MSIAAVLLMRERRLVEDLRAAGATGPESARPLAELAGADGLALRRLSHRAVIRETPGGAYYLDEPSWVALRRMRMRIMAIVIAAGLLVTLALYLGLSR